jgi:hypothetical protein
MDENRLQSLENRILELEKKQNSQGSLVDFFSDKIIFNKKVKFNANVYDANGGVVTEINNL